MRNVRKNMGKEDAGRFNKELENIKLSTGLEEGVAKFSALLERYKERYPGFIKYLEKKKEGYLNFLRYPFEIRKHIYTTNAVESLNARIEMIRMRLGGYFQSVNILELNLLLQTERLRQNKWKKTSACIKGKLI